MYGKTLPNTNLQVFIDYEIFCIYNKTYDGYIALSHWGVEVQIHSFLISALVVDACSASCPGCLPPWEEPLASTEQ
jgi:hypothetical protein